MSSADDMATYNGTAGGSVAVDVIANTSVTDDGNDSNKCILSNVAKDDGFHC